VTNSVDSGRGNVRVNAAIGEQCLIQEDGFPCVDVSGLLQLTRSKRPSPRSSSSEVDAISADESKMNDAISRFHIVRQCLPVAFRDPVFVESWSNDVWVTKEFVLRVCWRGECERLLREHELLTALPVSVPHASVVASGRIESLTWMLLRRIKGERFDLVWPRLSTDARRDAVMDLGDVLRSLHEWVPPTGIRALLANATQTVPESRDGVIGSTIVPLPLERVSLLLDSFEDVPDIGDDLLRRVRMRIDNLRTVVSTSEFLGGLVVHGDAHLANALWFEGSLVALLDFEWARIGPPDLELEAACREDPVIEGTAELWPIPESVVPMLVWLRAGYPELFNREDLTERLWLYDLCYQVRRLSISGINSFDRVQLNRLNLLVDGPRVQFAI
jgi:hypothetical protein